MTHFYLYHQTNDTYQSFWLIFSDNDTYQSFLPISIMTLSEDLSWKLNLLIMTHWSFQYISLYNDTNQLFLPISSDNELLQPPFCLSNSTAVQAKVVSSGDTPNSLATA